MEIFRRWDFVISVFQTVWTRMRKQGGDDALSGRDNTTFIHSTILSTQLSADPSTTIQTLPYSTSIASIYTNFSHFPTEFYSCPHSNAIYFISLTIQCHKFPFTATHSHMHSQEQPQAHAVHVHSTTTAAADKEENVKKNGEEKRSPINAIAKNLMPPLSLLLLQCRSVIFAPIPSSIYFQSFWSTNHLLVDIVSKLLM